MKPLINFYHFYIFIATLSAIFLVNPDNFNLVYSQFSTDLDSVAYRLFEDFFPIVTVEYESNTLVVLRGDEDSLLMLNGTLGPLWNAIDIVETEKGFKMKEMITSGIGSKGNPTRIYAIMEK